MHQERNPTTIIQILAQIQDLQNNVNSSSDATEFYGAESGRSSGATHESYDCESIIDSNWGCTEQSVFFYAGEFRNPVRASSSGASLSTLDYSESQDHAFPRYWIAARYTEYCGYFRKCFRTTTCPRRTILNNLRRFTEFGIFFCKIADQMLKEIQRDRRVK